MRDNRGILTGHVARVISLWEGLEGGRSAATGDGPSDGTPAAASNEGDLEIPERTITGWWHGRPVELCNGCQYGYLEMQTQWKTCECGRKRCARCRARGCECGRDRRRSDAEDQRDDMNRIEEDQAHAWWDMRQVPADLYDQRDNGYDLPLTIPEQATGGEAVEDQGAACTLCGIGLAIPGSSWRICSCGATVCVPCERGQCNRCGRYPIYSGPTADTPARRWWNDEGPMQDSGAQAVGWTRLTERSAREDHPPSPPQGPPHDRDPPVTTLTPLEADRRRAAMQHDAAARRKARRAEQNNAARQQIRAGLRPPPRKTAGKDTVITCANVTSSGPWEGGDEARLRPQPSRLHRHPGA